MDIRELRAMTDEQLTDVFEDMKEQLYRLRLNHATGELVDTSQFRNTRRAIARALTVVRERQIAAQGKKG
jgi:large subunit ribosomal protein L29